jgi:hypothetical protein
MIYTLTTDYPTTVANAGTGGPSIWVDPEEFVGFVRVGTPGDQWNSIYVPHLETGDWYPVRDTGWWVRLVSWRKLEVEYRN